MGVNLTLKELAKSSFRTAISLTFAGIALIVIVAIYTWAKESYDKRQALPYESIRDWRVELKDQLSLDVRARTKVISGKLLVSIDIAGHPTYLSDRRNANAQFNFEFLDQDGFKVLAKPLKLSEFTTTVGKNEERTGLNLQFEDYIDIESYKRFSKMQVGWNMETKAAPAVTPEAMPHQQTLDHCAPNLSKVERLKRLSQHGPVRETGTGNYAAGDRSVHFFSDGSLLNCH